jgi:NTP pyrophosphatase (non-canonical NTP hydrolase)
MNSINILKEYEDFMQTSKFYPQDKLPITYPALGLNGEAGEVAEKVKKCWRDNGGVFDDYTKKAILKELADTLWYIWACADDMGYTLKDVLQTGITKVRERQETNTIHGNGDDREKNQKVFIGNTNANIVEIEESLDKLPKRILSINSNDFDSLKRAKYEMSYISKHAKVILKVDNVTYNAKFKGVGRMDGSILLQLENENDIDTIIKAIDNDYNSPGNLSINDIRIICPRASELPILYM